MGRKRHNNILNESECDAVNEHNTLTDQDYTLIEIALKAVKGLSQPALEQFYGELTELMPAIEVRLKRNTENKTYLFESRRGKRWTAIKEIVDSDRNLLAFLHAHSLTKYYENEWFEPESEREARVVETFDDLIIASRYFFTGDIERLWRWDDKSERRKYLAVFEFGRSSYGKNINPLVYVVIDLDKLDIVGYFQLVKVNNYFKYRIIPDGEEYLLRQRNKRKVETSYEFRDKYVRERINGVVPLLIKALIRDKDGRARPASHETLSSYLDIIGIIDSEIKRRVRMATERRNPIKKP